MAIRTKSWFGNNELSHEFTQRANQTQHFHISNKVFYFWPYMHRFCFVYLCNSAQLRAQQNWLLQAITEPLISGEQCSKVHCDQAIWILYFIQRLNGAACSIQSA